MSNRVPLGVPTSIDTALIFQSTEPGRIPAFTDEMKKIKRRESQRRSVIRIFIYVILTKKQRRSRVRVYAMPSSFWNVSITALI